jgi:hypothetical protein
MQKNGDEMLMEIINTLLSINKRSNSMKRKEFVKRFFIPLMLLALMAFFGGCQNEMTVEPGDNGEPPTRVHWNCWLNRILHSLHLRQTIMKAD